ATSVFFGGQIYCNFGAFSQGTFERPSSVWFLDNTDVRYAKTTNLAGLDMVLGITGNNNPTVQDPWNTTPAWSFPFVAASGDLAFRQYHDRGRLCRPCRRNWRLHFCQ